MTSQQPTEPNAGSEPFLDPVEEILTAAIEEFGGDWSRVEEQLCARHPADASAIRWRIAALRDGSWLQPPDVPARLGDFEPVAEIGRGGMGAVYEARQVSLDRRVALKILPYGVTLQPELLARFKREAMTVARLRHPGIVQVYAEGEADGIHFFAMELVEGLGLDKIVAAVRERGAADMGGAQLAALLRGEEDDAAAERAATGGHDDSGTGATALRGGFLEVAVGWIAEVADALEYAHQEGVVHRDVKPSNILVRRSGSACLTDFGLAREASQPGITQSGQMVGSPHYMSPEQIRGRAVDARTDVFSLGTTLYELATFQVPFQGATSREVLDRILTREPRDPQRLNPQINEDLATVILKAMEKDLPRRYPTMAALRDDLRAWLERRPVSARRVSRIGRLWRWSRREPWKAGLAAALAISLPVIGALYHDYRARQADVALAERVQRQERVDELLVAGYLDILDSRYARAVSTLGEVLALAPGSVEAKAGIAVALVRDGKPDAAVRGLGSVPEGSGLGWARLYALRHAGRDEEADALAASLPEPRAPTESWVAGFALLRDSYWERDRPRAQQALTLLSRAVQGASAPKPIHLAEWANAAHRAHDVEAARASDLALEPFLDKFPALVRFQARARMRHDPRAALPLFERVVLLWPDSSAAHSEQGRALLGCGRTDEAIESFQEAIRLYTRNSPPGAGTAVLHFNLGRALTRAKRFVEAAEALERCLSLRPRLPDALYNLGVVYQRSGPLEEAVETYRRCLEVDPEKLEAWINLGTALSRLERRDEAIDAYQAAVRLDPRSDKAQRNLALEYEKTGDWSAAVDAWRRTYVLRDDVGVNARFGMALAKVGDLHSAEFHHRRAVELAPDLPATHQLLGHLLKQKGDLDGAVQCFRAALRVDPGYVDSLHSLGRSLEALGKKQEAIDANRRYTELRPTNPIPHVRLLRSFLDAGDGPAVVRELVRWIRAQPDDPSAWTEPLRRLGDPDTRIEQPGSLLEVAQRMVDDFGAEVPELHYVLATLQRQVGLTTPAIASLRAYLESETTRCASDAFQRRAADELAAWQADRDGDKDGGR